MPIDTGAGKALIQSKTFWGAVTMIVAFVLPKYALALRASIDDIVMVAGFILTIVGRFTAKQPVTSLILTKKG